MPEISHGALVAQFQKNTRNNYQKFSHKKGRYYPAYSTLKIISSQSHKIDSVFNKKSTQESNQIRLYNDSIQTGILITASESGFIPK